MGAEKLAQAVISSALPPPDRGLFPRKSRCSTKLTTHLYLATRSRMRGMGFYSDVCTLLWFVTKVTGQFDLYELKL
jgi:hypothetical protein